MKIYYNTLLNMIKLSISNLNNAHQQSDYQTHNLKVVGSNPTPATSMG